MEANGSNGNGGLMVRGASVWSRRRSAVLLTLAVIVATGPLIIAPRAMGAAPVVANSGGPVSARNWLESLAMADDTRGHVVRVTAVVQHDLGVQVNQLQFDDDWDGTANEALESIAVTPQKPSGNFNYSRVTQSFNPNRPSGLSCRGFPFFDGTRRTDNRLLYMRARTTDGQFTGWVSGEVDFVEDSQCTGADDFPYLYSWGSGNTASITPGANVTFNFTGDDADVTGSNDHFARYRWRVRRLNDGALVQGPSGMVNACGDNCNNQLTVNFPQRGRFVVEAELGGEDDGDGNFANGGRWFWVGAVDVNTSASTSPTLNLTGPSGDVQQGASIVVNANALDTEAFQGRIQMIEWDADGNGSFERREVAATEASGLTAAQLQQTVDTTGLSGTRTVVARVTDNGAINGADDIRRTTTDSFTFTINRPPNATNQTVNTNEDTPASFTLNASDPDGHSLSVTIDDPPDHGTLGGSGLNRTYTPDANFNGTDSVGYTVTDGHGSSDTATVTINVASVNDAPIADDQNISTGEDTPVNGTLTATDVDHSSGSLAFSVGDAPSNGDVTVNPNGTFTYTPDPNFNGSDDFTYEVCDLDGACDEGAVDVTVSSINDPPVPQDQEIETDEDTALPITLSATDADGDPLIFGIGTPPAHGTLTGTAPNLTYTPAQDYFGPDSFTFTVTDSNVSATGSVDITVNQVNDAPVAQDQSVATDEDTALSGTLGATDIDDVAGDLAFDTGSGPAHGQLTVNSDGSFAYTPDANYNGPDSFTFTVCDPDDACDTGHVDITVTAVNDPPVADDQDVSTNEDTALAITLTGSDADGDALTFDVDGEPAHGTLNGIAPVLEYVPDADYFGPDTFTFTASDGEVAVSGTVDITVNAVNDAPVASDQDVVGDEDTAIVGSVSASDVDNAADDLSFAATGEPGHGTVILGEDGSFTYAPDEHFNGTDSFGFEVCDPNGACDEGTVDVTVQPVNDAPETQDVTAATDEDQTVLLELPATDVDGDELSYSFSAPSNGAVVGSGPQVAYTPQANFHGTDTFTFTVSDGMGGTDTGTVTVTVAPVNDLPDAIPQTLTTAEDTPLDVTLTAEDIEGDDVTFEVTGEPAHGTLSGTAPNVTYTPDPDFSGNDFFEFTACDTSDACDTAIVSIAVSEAPLIATNIIPEAAVARVEATAVPGAVGAKVAVPLQLRSTLVRLDDGTPIAGEPLVFSVDGQTVCTATTDAKGVADCGGVVEVLLSVLALGYRVDYAGDADRTPASVRGPIVIVTADMEVGAGPVRIRLRGTGS